MKGMKITVGGEPGAGKSTVIAIIEKALTDAGIQVTITANQSLETPKRRAERIDDPESLTRLADKIHVELEEVQHNRQASMNPALSGFKV